MCVWNQFVHFVIAWVSVPEDCKSAGVEIQLGVLQVQSGSYSYKGFGKVCSTMPPLFHSRMWVNCCSSQRHPQYTPIELWWVKVQDPERKTPRHFGFWFFYQFCFFCFFEMVWVLLHDLLKVKLGYQELRHHGVLQSNIPQGSETATGHSCSTDPRIAPDSSNFPGSVCLVNKTADSWNCHLIYEHTAVLKVCLNLDLVDSID